MSNESIERAFRIAGRCSLEVSNISGGINVRGVPGSEVTVKARKEDRGQGSADSTQIEIEQEGDRVVARVRFPQGGIGIWGMLDGRNRPADVFFDVTCPSDSDVAVHGVTCPIEVHAIKGKVSSNTVSGSAKVDGIDGKLSMNVVSGDLTARRIRGDVHVKSVSGGIGVIDSDSAVLRANSISGDIRLETKRAISGASISTVSGACELALPPTTPCTVTTHTVSGSTRCDLPAKVLESKRTRWKAEINGGGPDITFNSVSGSFVLRPMTPGAIDVTPPGPAQGATFVEREPVSTSPGSQERTAASGAESEPAPSASSQIPPVPQVPPVPPVPSAPPTPAESPPNVSRSDVRNAGASPVPPVSPLPPAPSATVDAPAGRTAGPSTADDADETMRILKAIERGEMSVDDGLGQLQQLDRRGKE